jgi:hypothetical protein
VASPGPKDQDLRIRRETVVITAIAALLAAGAGLAIWQPWKGDWPAHHFAVVQPDVLYRSGQPDEAGLRDILRDHQIRTVVNLRGARPGESWWRGERDVCRDCGVRLVDVEIDSQETVVSGLQQFLTVAADSNCHPVLVHCEAGSVRTGFAVAAYRIVMQGWSHDDALAEAERMRFDPQMKLSREYDRLLRLLAGGEDWRKLGGGAAPASGIATGPAQRP